MGVGRSRPFGMAWEEAWGALSTEEKRRLETAWRRWRSPGSETLPRRSFREVVLSPDVPASIADQIFNAFVGRSRDGLTFKELIVAMVVLSKSDRSLRHRFLFHIFSEDGEVVVTAKVLERLRGAGEPISKALQRAIASTDKLSASDFPAWMESVKEEIPLAAWLLDSPPRLTSTDPMATFYQSLAGVTHLEEAEIAELEKHWWNLLDEKTRKLDEARLGALVSPPLPHSLVPGLFAAFDENKDGQIDLKELVCGLSASARGPSTERSKFLFKVFDRDADGALSPKEVKAMVDLLGELQTPGPRTEPSTLVAEIQAFSSSPSKSLTLEEFLLWAVARPLLDSLLCLILEVSHVVLGLRPQSKATESQIVKAWYHRSLAGRRLEEGQTWYLISAKWWDEWERWNFSASPPPTPTPMQRPLSQAQPEAATQQTQAPTTSGPTPLRRDSVVEWREEEVHISSASASEASLPRTTGSGDSSPPSSQASPRRRFSAGRWSPCPRLHPTSLLPPSSTAATAAAATSGAAPKTRPGPIDNSALLEKEEKGEWRRLPSLSGEGGLLRGGLVELRDFVRVPEALWSALVRWYGGGVASPPLPRSVVLGSSKELELELYPLTLVILRHQTGPGPRARSAYTGTTGSAFTAAFSTAAASVSRSLHDATKDWHIASKTPPRRVPQHRLSLSRTAQVGHIASALAAALRLSPEASRLWLLPDSPSSSSSSAAASSALDEPEREMFLLEEEELPLAELSITTGSLILLELRNKDLTWPEEMSRLVKSLGSGDGGALRAPSSGQPPGVTGLYNLGNTCYMNSAIQLVSNTGPLTRYFRRGLHRVELNKENVLGMRGNVALAYAELLSELWSGKAKFVAPLRLKATIGKYESRFNDLNQHDCQELLAFLLDGLHEDLNRVTLKPYVELKDSAGRPDALVAAEAWDNHLRRNQSVMVDLFHGLLRSQVECLSCGGLSTRFDPFTFLSLPLPLDDSLLFKPVLLRLDGSQPRQFGLRVPADQTLADLAKALAALAHLRPEQLLLLELTHTASILRFLQAEDKVKRLASVQNSCLLFALEIPLAENASTAASPPPPPPSRVANGHVPGGSGGSGSAPTHSGHERTPSSMSGISVVSASEASEARGIPSLGPSLGFTLCLHRKFEQQDTYFLAHQRARPIVFGLPLVLPLSGNETGEGLLSAVWAQVARLVSPPSQHTAGLPTNQARDGDLDPSAPDFPFRLSFCNWTGSGCALCPWYKLCQGCPLPTRGAVTVPEGAWLGVDWDLTALHLRYQHSTELAWAEDVSVEAAAEAHRSPVSLNSCLKAFTEEEKLADPVYCSSCKSQQSAKKRLAIWKLPPILLVHFKRFQYVANRWAKSTKMVTFTKSSTNFGPFVASIHEEPVEPVPAASSPGKGGTEGGGEGELEKSSEEEKSPTPLKDEDSSAVVVGEPRSSGDIELLMNDGLPSGAKSPVRKLISSVKGRGGVKGTGTLEGDENPAYEAPSQSSPSPAGKTRSESVAPMLRPNDHRLLAEAEPGSLNYDLYGIAVHYGVLGAGHYVAYAKQGPQWFLYNDSKTKAVDEEDVDGTFAYLLFFQRQGLDEEAYLPAEALESEARLGPLNPGMDQRSPNPSDSSSDHSDKCSLM